MQGDHEEPHYHNDGWRHQQREALFELERLREKNSERESDKKLMHTRQTIVARGTSVVTWAATTASVISIGLILLVSHATETVDVIGNKR